MSTSIACPKCGAANKVDARFCATCGTPLSPITQPLPAPSPTIGAPFPSPQASYSTDYASVMAEHDKTQGISRTKTGLLLLIIGLLIGPIPLVGIIGSILDLIGAILVIVGRSPFGPEHSRNTILVGDNLRCRNCCHNHRLSCIHSLSNISFYQ